MQPCYCQGSFRREMQESSIDIQLSLIAKLPLVMDMSLVARGKTKSLAVVGFVPVWPQTAGSQVIYIYIILRHIDVLTSHQRPQSLKVQVLLTLTSRTLTACPTFCFDAFTLTPRLWQRGGDSNEGWTGSNRSNQKPLSMVDSGKFPSWNQKGKNTNEHFGIIPRLMSASVGKLQLRRDLGM